MYRHIARPLALAAIASLLSACGGGGGGSSTYTPSGSGATPTPPATGSYVSCAQNGVQPSLALRSPLSNPRSGFAEHLPRHAPLHFTGSTSGSQTEIAVTYSSATAAASAPAIANAESASGAHFVRSTDFTHAGLVMHVLSVPSDRVAAVEAQLSAQSGVQSVGAVNERRYPTTVAQAYFPNDPYFDGFSTTVAPTPGATLPPATYHVAPYDESANVPGEWGMHAICLGYAFDYSQSGNGSGIPPNANALGSTSVKIALIDTGQDTTHPDLSSKVVYAKSFVNGVSSSGTHDEWGHGTDTAGLAAGAINNALGFTSAGGNVVIYGYRVFQDPDSNCSNPSTNDPVCAASTGDIASAIEDAVGQHVNVISISLGGGPCPDASDEANAIHDAIAANIIVVAASGNGGSSQVDAPACDSGVIAVGATSLADGQINGAGNTNGTAALPYEYVSSFSNYGSPAASPGSSSAWGIVAPGGDPDGDTDADDLHWIEDIWTSTPYNASFAGNCTGDYPTDAGTADCRILIAGTSMATPVVAGAAALILSVNSSYQSPSAMRQLLCSTADDIKDSREGCGRLNVYRAMAKALGDSTLP